MSEYKRSKRHKTSGRSYSYLPVAAVLFAAALLIGMSGFFRVSEIVVTGAKMYSEEEIIEASDLEIGDNLLIFSEAKVSQRINDNLSYAGGVRVVVKYPSTVEIVMDESVAIASIVVDGYYWIIDTNGKIVEQSDMKGAAETIVVTGIEITEPKIGEKIQSDNSIKVTYLVDILKTIHENGADDKITKLDITSIANISFDYDGRYTVGFGEGGDSADKFRTMMEVINNQREPDEIGTIEIDNKGGIHVIPE